MISGIRAALLVALLSWSGAAVADDWGLDELGQALADAPNGRIAFREERSIAFLAAPIIVTGYVARQDGRIEKHVVAPKRESVILDGSHMEVESDDGWQSYDIDDHPALRGLATALQAGLTGRFEPAEDLFDIDVTGDRAAWAVTLSPKPGPVAEAIEAIALTGMAARIDTIEIREADGDRSLMTLRHGSE
ncbi:MAG: LolA-related protein [Pseudomonadota bacterium]|nr:LolA-related protein [Pseudomonadota bacterium]